MFKSSKTKKNENFGKSSKSIKNQNFQNINSILNLVNNDNDKSLKGNDNCDNKKNPIKNTIQININKNPNNIPIPNAQTGSSTLSQKFESSKEY